MDAISPGSTKPAGQDQNGKAGGIVAVGLTIFLCCIHGWLIFRSMGGWEGIKSPWPLARHDHPTYFHSAIITRRFLALHGTTAGYDPSFMSGYAKSVVFPSSSTLPEVVIAICGRTNPVLAYKGYVLVSAAILPWLVALAMLIWRMKPGAIATSVGLFLVYVWSDYPINHALFGMLPYLVAIPLALTAQAAIARYLDQGGSGWWLASACLATLAFLAHLTTALIVVPTTLAVYIERAIACRLRSGPRLGSFGWQRHLGVGSIALVVLACNAFWWLPGLWLAGTKGASDIAFFHDEPVIGRLAKILTNEATIERILWVIGLLGFLTLGSKKKDRARLISIAGFALLGFAWGYLAGKLRSLDFLQPGRQTYACYSALAVASGAWASRSWEWMKAKLGLAGCLIVTTLAIVVGVFMIGNEVKASVVYRVFSRDPFLSSKPPPHLSWIVARVERYVARGERLLYEEGGKDLRGVPDPFQGGRYSGLLPYLTGIEVIGGPYLHASLTTNFTQFGEGKLFEASGWDRDRFFRYAKLYRPTAIVCWSPWARSFCRKNGDLVEVLEDDGRVLIGRVRGFGGVAVRGTAEIASQPGRLIVFRHQPDVDGLTVVRYHLIPGLASSPAVGLVPVYLEGDPVPFIGLPRHEGPLTLEFFPFGRRK